MLFRIIGLRGALRPLATAARSARKIGLGVAFLAAFASPALAQSTLDFVDPLDTERVRIEEKADPIAPRQQPRETAPRSLEAPERGGSNLLTRARDGASSGVDAAQESTSELRGSLRTALAAVGAKLGISSASVLGILALLIVGIATLVGWTLFRGRNRRRRKSRVYEEVKSRSSRETAKRRVIGSATTARPATEHLQPDFEERMPEDFDAIFAEETPVTSEERAPAPIPDPKEWRKPNLDRLRDSIKADWKADKAEKPRAKTTRPVTAPTPATAAAAAATDPAERKLDDLSDGWDDWDAQDKPEDDPWGETLPSAAPAEADESTAAHRIRALRESLRAS